MRAPPPAVLGRRAALARVLLLPAALQQLAVPRAALAGDRSVAQSVGVDQFPLGDLQFVWGGQDRCDPTDAACRAGGQSLERAATQPLLGELPGRTVTDRVRLGITVGGESVGAIELGLWREAAPESVDALVRLSKGQLVGEPGDEPAALERSIAVRCIRDEALVLGGLKQTGGSTRLVAGKTRPVRFPVAPPKTADASNGASHNAAGLVSVRRGGGSFELTLTPRPNAGLDKDNLVVGQVLNAEGMELLERVNTLPTNNYDNSPLATVKVSSVRVL